MKLSEKQIEKLSSMLVWQRDYADKRMRTTETDWSRGYMNGLYDATIMALRIMEQPEPPVDTKP